MSKKKEPVLEPRVWIELEVIWDRPDLCHERAKLATQMLRKLGATVSEFWFHEKKGRYCMTMDSGGSFVELEDSGHWFKLDVLAA